MNSIFIKIIILFFFLASCTNQNEQKKEKTEVLENQIFLTDIQKKNANLTYTELTKVPITSTLYTSGVIDVPPQNLISISMPMGGFLKESKLLPGLHVRKGEVLAIMEDQLYIQLQEDFLQSKTHLDLLRAEYERQKLMDSDQASSTRAVQTAEIALKSGEIKLKSLAEKLKLIKISPEKLNINTISGQVKVYSPIDGFVSKIMVNTGKYVTPSEILFELVDPSDIHLNLAVFEKDLQNLEIGQNVIAYRNSQPTKKYLSKVILISKDITEDHTAEVHCHFEGPFDKILIPGMYMNGEITIGGKVAFALPDEAIVTFGEGDFVFENKGTYFESIPIKKGITHNGYTEIINIDKIIGKKIVQKGAYTLLMKLKNTEEE